MNTKPLFTPTADGAAYDIQPAGVLMLLAEPPLSRYYRHGMLRG